jgi:hypothetical protein
VTPEQRFRRNLARIEARDEATRRSRRVFNLSLLGLTVGAYFFGAVMGAVYRRRR